MKVRKQLSVFNICLLLAFILIPQQGNSQDERGNEYRITLFPSHKITEKITGFAYLGYVWNPEKNYQTYYFGYPAACYSFKPWLQVWGGLNHITASTRDNLIRFVSGAA